MEGQGLRHDLKGQDYNAVLHLNLTDVYHSKQQVIEVNGKKLRMTIPAGVEDGQTIKIAGKGGPGANGGPMVTCI